MQPPGHRRIDVPTAFSPRHWPTRIYTLHRVSHCGVARLDSNWEIAESGLRRAIHCLLTDYCSLDSRAYGFAPEHRTFNALWADTARCKVALALVRRSRHTLDALFPGKVGKPLSEILSLRNMVANLTEFFPLGQRHATCSLISREMCLIQVGDRP